MPKMKKINVKIDMVIYTKTRFLSHIFGIKIAIKANFAYLSTILHRYYLLVFNILSNF